MSFYELSELQVDKSHMENSWIFSESQGGKNFKLFNLICLLLEKNKK